MMEKFVELIYKIYSLYIIGNYIYFLNKTIFKIIES